MSVKAVSQIIRLEKRDGAGIIIINNPPINVSTRALRERLLDAIRSVDADENLIGGILIGAGKMFMAGSDIREFGAPLEEPQLPAVIAAIEGSAKPFVAAIAGAALGGGYELALGCDYRIASREAVVGLPEATLGMIPGAGGTQRLPRLVGRKTAVELICAGTRVPAGKAAELGMIDAVADGDLQTEAMRILAQMAPNKRRLTDIPVPESDPIAFQEAKATALKLGRGRHHIHAALTAVENCGTLSVQAGLDAERSEFHKLRMGREAAALRHLFFAERSTLKAPPLSGVATRPVDTVAVVGGGTMGSGIAAALLEAGKSVTIVENTAGMAEAAKNRVRAIFQGKLDRGRISIDGFSQVMSLLEVTEQRGPLATADVVVEAVYEELGIKQEIFALLGRLAKPGALLLTNTSYLSVAEIAAASGRPHDVAGMHFFSPAETMRLVEIVQHKETAPTVLATALSLAKTAGKLPVLTRDSFGFIGNRIYAAYRRQCEFMLEEGAQVEAIDQALEEFGFAMGPFAVADMSGLDIAWRMRQAIAANRDPAERYVQIPDLLCEMGRLGRKTRAGYYQYPVDSRRREIDPIVTDLVATASSAAGRIRRPFTAAEIVERSLGAMASEAAFVISEGVATSPSDIDLVMTNGYGFPKHEGGPVFWAQNQTRQELHAVFNRLAETGAAHFRLGPISALLPDAEGIAFE